MSHKKRSKNTPVTQQPVLVNNVFAHFMQEAASMSNELGARRAFCDEVGAFLKDRGLIEDFEAHRAARKI